MHISLNLPQFIKKRTLLVVTDKENAKFYLASNGVLDELIELAIHPINDGAHDRKNIRVLRRRQGSLIDSPRGLESAYFAFARRVNAACVRMLRAKRFSQIYVFGPHHYHRELLDRLHSYVRARVVRVYSGDFIHDHPLEIIRRSSELPS